MIDIEKQFRTVINKFTQKSFDATQEALKTAAEDMAVRLKNATPVDTGLFKNNWKVKSYHNVCYVYNERGGKGINKGMPLTNISEYSNRGPAPFISKTWERNKNEIKKIFIKDFERRIKK